MNTKQQNNVEIKGKSISELAHKTGKLLLQHNTIQSLTKWVLGEAQKLYLLHVIVRGYKLASSILWSAMCVNLETVIPSNWKHWWTKSSLSKATSRTWSARTLTTLTSLIAQTNPALNPLTCLTQSYYCCCSPMRVFTDLRESWGWGIGGLRSHLDPYSPQCWRSLHTIPYRSRTFQGEECPSGLVALLELRLTGTRAYAFPLP